MFPFWYHECMSLTNKKCKSCEDKNAKALSMEEIADLLMEVPGWGLSPDGDMISREFSFSSFDNAISFVSDIAKVAEGEGHHPDIHVFYDKVRLDIKTHSIGALTENDFILAAKVDAIVR